MTYSGECFGGPYHGQHKANMGRYFQVAIYDEPILCRSPGAAVDMNETVKVGTYQWNPATGMFVYSGPPWRKSVRHFAEVMHGLRNWASYHGISMDDVKITLDFNGDNAMSSACKMADHIRSENHSYGSPYDPRFAPFDRPAKFIGFGLEINYNQVVTKKGRAL